MSSIAVSAPAWKKTRWNDEPAWVSVDGAVKAVVSETRCRLIYLGPAARDHNLLSAPTTLSQPIPGQDIPNWGGHRFWLGPQSRWSWPPLKEWEFSPAEKVEIQGVVLRLFHPHLNSAYPALIREYSWNEGKLRCTVRWRAAGAPFYAMQVVAIEAPVSIPVQLHRWDHVPEGLVGVQGDAPKTQGILPNPAIKIDGNDAVISSGHGKYKLGFISQPLVAQREGWKLAVHPGPYTGVAIESPDFGYLSQLWVGDPVNPFSELEQLTPFLLADPTGWCSSTIYFEATPTPL